MCSHDNAWLRGPFLNQWNLKMVNHDNNKRQLRPPTGLHQSESDHLPAPRAVDAFRYRPPPQDVIVAGAFAHPDEAGNGEYLPLVGDFMSFNEIVDTLNRQGHEFSFKQVPKEIFAALVPGAAEIAATFSHFQANTYLGSDSHDQIALANKIAGTQPSKLSTWARANFPEHAFTEKLARPSFLESPRA